MCKNLVTKNGLARETTRDSIHVYLKRKVPQGRKLFRLACFAIVIASAETTYSAIYITRKYHACTSQPIS